MERIVYKFTLDVTKIEPQKMLTGLWRGESKSRQLRISLKNGKTPITFDGQTETVSMFVRKPSDESPSVNACTLEGNTIVYDILQSDVSETGVISFTLKINFYPDNAPAIAYAATFEAQVCDPNCDESHVPSQPTYTALDELLTEVQEIETEMEGHASDAEAWAVGQRDGSDVPSTDPTYHNNSYWHSQSAHTYAYEAQYASNQAEGYRNQAQSYAAGSAQKAQLAQGYANDASASASTATQKASDASSSATSASASASEAATSATAAASSASTASTKASQAFSSASNAASSASSAASSATSAASSASSAAASASVVRGKWVLGQGTNSLITGGDAKTVLKNSFSSLLTEKNALTNNNDYIAVYGIEFDSHIFVPERLTGIFKSTTLTSLKATCCDIGATSITFRQLIMCDTAADCKYLATTIDNQGAVTITDYSDTTISGGLKLHFSKYIKA